jgi:hypothetical protein
VTEEGLALEQRVDRPLRLNVEVETVARLVDGA